MYNKIIDIFFENVWRIKLKTVKKKDKIVFLNVMTSNSSSGRVERLVAVKMY